MDLGKEILKDIKSRGIKLCEDYTERIKRTNSYGFLCSLYFKGDDWSLSNDFPGLGILRKHKKGIIPFGLLVDVQNNYLNLQKAAILGDSEVQLIFDSYSVGDIRIRHNSRVSVVAKDNSIVNLICLDSVEVIIEAQDSSKVIVYSYGEDVQIKKKGNVKIIKSKWI